MKIHVSAPARLDPFENLIILGTSDAQPDMGGRSLPEAALIARLREMGDFKGKRGKSLVLYGQDGRRCVLAGLGAGESLDEAAWRDAGAAAQVALAGLDAKEAGLILPAGANVRALCTGLLLSGYKYDRFISAADKKGKRLEAVTLILPPGADTAPVERGAEGALIAAQGVALARDLLCAPANLATPDFLAREAAALAAASAGRIRCRVMGETELEAGNFRALLAVGQGSAQESRLIVLEYPADAAKAAAAARTLVLVGKGVTFDSGGISIKPALNMDEMKYDLGGAAAVLGVFKALGEMDLPWRVVGLVPAVENMPGGRAYRPGDILVTRSGLSVEVKSTDAEGRIILADALDYAKEFSPTLIIDVATLTGSCVVALGHEAAGLMVNPGGEPYAAALRASADRCGERIWPLPMWDEYAELLKSDFADMKNSAGRNGGAMAAGKFLQRFADPTPWIHLDIAGVAWTEKERGLVPKVGNGFGVRLILDFLESQA